MEFFILVSSSNGVKKLQCMFTCRCGQIIREVFFTAPAKIKYVQYFDLYQRFSTFMFCGPISYAQIVNIHNLLNLPKEAVVLPKQYQMAPANW